MDRYRKVERQKPESSINENEIRITSQGLVRSYITYAITLLQERPGREIVLKAMGLAISKTVAIAEIIKRRVPVLHQDTTISSMSLTDTYEPLEEGLFPVETTRHVSMISISLSTKELKKNSPGYQAPARVDQSKQQYNYQPQQQQQPQPRQPRRVYNAVNEDSYGRGGGRGGGRGRGRNWSRDGYLNYQEYDDYSNRGQGGGRGGGQGYRGNGYGRGGRGGRGYGRGRGRMGNRPRDYGNLA
ncbi:hypothetical protein RJ639_034980 [Escallonia herrerae]|uniref:DNA/RNA-binding protein Alba-like domain-containing protein n=1 Tax=Escallonia herrerae TaxID=1293975 RepID=A0AA88WX99_9ASTE|nr:hypothetical protein RJ639_034980 [Escallonia herrerae]